ncbi:MAG: adenylate/guanylate cyclase domain-containing protein [Melioribacteraceae bacterium]|nr:adenylate/guanylate cyclase domain-containing protein [Melioribacteraceae bacterium]
MKIFFKKFISQKIVKFGIALLSFLLVLIITQDYLFQLSFIKNIELNLIDKRFEVRGKKGIENPKVVIIEIEKDSYTQIPAPYNAWPWPRFLYAKLIKNLSEAGAKVIGIDILMSDRDRFNSVNDSLFMSAIRKYNNVVLAGKLDYEKQNMLLDLESGFWKNRSSKDRTQIISYDTTTGLIKQNFQNIFYQPGIQIGIVNLFSDNDQIYRKYKPYFEDRYDLKNSFLVPSFSFAVLNKFFNKSSGYVASKNDNYFLYDSINIPMFDHSDILINYYSGLRSFPYYKFVEIIDDSTFKTTDEIYYESELNNWDLIKDEGIFKDKIVLIGSTMPEDRDIFATSLSPTGIQGDNFQYGVEIHATTIQNILDKDFIYGESFVTEFIILFLITFFSFYLISFTKKIKLRLSLAIEILSIVIVLLLIYSIYLFSIYLFGKHSILINVVSPSLALLISYITATSYNFIIERKQKNLIKGMFGQYVSESFVNVLISDPAKLKLGGERKELTMLFSDIAGFTSISESKKPEELVSFINEYLSVMTEIVLSNQGTLDKYIGDAIMAFWGAPIELRTHAINACSTALQMQKKLIELNKKFSLSNENNLSVRIGINSGNVIVGNIGGSKRFDYTVMGDNVNLASRLESVNKVYSTCILIGENTYELIKDDFITRELDSIKVKGKEIKTNIYELFSTKDEVEPEIFSFIDKFSNALALYRNQKFEKAIIIFNDCFEKYSDEASKVFIERCNYFINNKPDEDWDGVFVLKSK